MKRLHVRVAVDEPAKSVTFHSTLFAAEPSVLKPDYAKSMLDDPRVNFAISAWGAGSSTLHRGRAPQGLGWEAFHTTGTPYGLWERHSRAVRCHAASMLRRNHLSD